METQKVLTTQNLVLRHYTANDAEFILRLLNEPSFIANIGDRKVRTLEDAKNYIASRLTASYEKYGFGLYMVELKDGTSIGMCGLVKRDPNEDPDIGFALLPEYWRKGYTYEASCGVLEFAKNILKLSRILGITIPSNTASIKTLEKIGLKFLKTDISKETGEKILVYEILV